MDALYPQAKQFLYQQHMENAEIVKDSEFHLAYVNEKLRHSLQVSGAGNGILRNEAYFQNRSAEFIDIAQTAIVLHDIFRFSEVRLWYLTGEKSDHGVRGAEMLKQTPLFNNPLITLSIKHHGHMIEEFYQDEEYNQITDSALKKDIEHIHFAVRDADKIANWQILTNEFEDMRLVWLPHAKDKSATQAVISEPVWQSFINEKIAPLKDINTNADKLIAVLGWLFDINYQYSITYCRRLNLFRKFFKLFEILGTNHEQINTIEIVVQTYVRKRFKENI